MSGPMNAVTQRERRCATPVRRAPMAMSPRSVAVAICMVEKFGCFAGLCEDIGVAVENM